MKKLIDKTEIEEKEKESLKIQKKISSQKKATKWDKDIKGKKK